MAEEKKKGGLKIIIIAIVAIIVLGVAVFFGVYLSMSKNAEPKEVVIVEAYTDLGEMTVNLSDEGGKRYARLKISVAYDSKNTELQEEITNKTIALRDTAIFYLKSLKADDFLASNEINLKTKLVERLNTNLKSGTILNVIFDNLLVQ